MHSRAVAFKDGSRFYDHTIAVTTPRILRYIVDTYASGGWRFTGCVRWFIDGKPCRVLNFAASGGNNVSTVYVQFV